MTTGIRSEWFRLAALIGIVLLAPGNGPLRAQQPAAGADKSNLKSADQLDSLVAPVALYPDPLLAQVFAASTYPLEIVQAARWLAANSKLTGENLTKAAAKQPWDASVQALVAFPDALKFLDQNLQWTTDLGNAFLDQQKDVMEAVQRMRQKANEAGKLTTTKEQKVEVKTVETKTIIQIVPSDPQIIYVPTYSPTVVYGPPVYAYPPVVYPPSAYVATAAVSFTAGVMVGAFWSGCCGGGGWGWGCSWGHNDITINNNFYNRYDYNNINNLKGGNRTNVGNTAVAGNTWQHNPDHRGAVPYSNTSTAQQYGGAARDSLGQTQRFDRTGQPRTTLGQADRGSRPSAGNFGASRAPSGTGDNVGNRSLPSGDRSRQSSAFAGTDSRARAQAASDRGFSSMRQSGAGGFGAGRTGGGRQR